jgi:hypothetical protein
VKRLLAIALCATAFLGVSAGSAFAGEVKGPPGTPNNTNTTGALDHAHSACAASGLNDLDSEEGQTVSQVQTAADSWKYYGLPKGAPGTLGLCRGNDSELWVLAPAICRGHARPRPHSRPCLAQIQACFGTEAQPSRPGYRRSKV